MKKRVFVFAFALILFLLPSILSSEIDFEIKKLTNYALEYETGNINYVQFLVYSSSVREKMNEILGVTGREMGGLVKEEQLNSVLGAPTEETKWVWMEGEEKEKKMDNSVPVWKKIVFDGRKIQVRLNAWPSIFGKKEFKENENKNQENEQNKDLKDLEGKLVYRLNIETEFKKPEEQLNIQSKIEDIKTLAQAFNSNPSSENAEILAKESVNAEMNFKSYFTQSGGKCEDIMNGIFGTENKRRTQQMYVQEITFCEGDNFEVIARLEMCDECEGKWINLDLRVEGRGPGFKMKEGEMNQQSPETFKDMDSASIEQEIINVINEIKQACDNKNFNSIMSLKNKLWPLNEALNQKSNDVWKDLDKTYQSQVESMTQEQKQKFDQNYGWIKLEQEKRKKADELSKLSYEKRKQFYLNLFSSYDKKESYYTQIEYEKRLVEEFRVKGREICDNNKDDNENEAVDCADEQCGGKICGKEKKSVQNGNETTEQEINLYCIQKECKAREEIKEVIRNVSNVCPELPAIECEQGSKVFFSRYDNETNCPIETSCLKETESCNVKEDCVQPACGITECIENKCEVTELTECKDLECSEGDKKICESDGIIVEICDNGFWKKTGECVQEPEIKDEIIRGDECLTANDCGSNNICNNGKCEVLPQIIITELIEEQIQEPFQEQQEQSEETQEQQVTEEPSQEQQEQSQEQTQITGNIIFKFATRFISKLRLTGEIIKGVDAEETQSSEPPVQEAVPQDSSQNPSDTSESNQEQQTQQPGNQQQTNQDEERRRQEDERRNQENRQREDERRQEENKERCKNDCKRPCIEKCIRDDCGNELNCVVEEAQKKCEESCKPEDSCIKKCIQGGDWWKDFENKDEHKEEKGVFQVGGNCKTNQGKTEGFIWFGGWGEPFQKIQYLKNKYYSGGQADWCKDAFENLKKQRQEFEKGFNQEFVTWFFEKYLPNSAEDWEQSVSGIFELYWKDVDNAREMAFRMDCLGTNELPAVNLINVKYESEYGSIEFWEEIKTVRLGGMDKEVQVISPYMKAWIFPSKEFMEFELKNAMKNHEFPGGPEQKTERKNEEGPTAEERKQIKNDKKFMSQITKIVEKYNGNLDAVIRFMDNEKIVFNLYMQINEEDILKMKPMLPEEVPEEDIRIDIEFQKLYDLIYTEQKEMSGQRIESPPWDRKIQPIQKIKEIANGIKMFFKVRDMLNSAKISPETSEKDVKALMKSFFYMMMKSDKNSQSQNEEEMQKQMEDEEGKQEKNSITGNIIFKLN